MSIDMEEKRRRARKWVNGYTAVGAAAVLPVAWIPGAATGVCCTLEATMCFQIGMIYKGSWTMAEATAAAGVIGLASVAGKIVALEATILLGPMAFLAKPPIAAAIIKTLGETIIQHFEHTCH